MATTNGSVCDMITACRVNRGTLHGIAR